MLQGGSEVPFAIKRIYEPASEEDGRRCLVDRLWPRGITKEFAWLDEWVKDAAPSPELRTWFAHKPERFAEFSEKYRAELHVDLEKKAAVRRLWEAGTAGRVTLLYAARDESVNHAAVLKEVLEGMRG